jgi:hypothetical protein
VHAQPQEHTQGKKMYMNMYISRAHAHMSTHTPHLCRRRDRVCSTQNMLNRQAKKEQIVCGRKHFATRMSIAAACGRSPLHVLHVKDSVILVMFCTLASMTMTTLGLEVQA